VNSNELKRWLVKQGATFETHRRRSELPMHGKKEIKKELGLS